MSAIRAIGIMSGTSCDGVDAVMIELRSLDERHTPPVLGHTYVPFPAALRAELRVPAALPLARVAELNFELAERYAEVVQQLPDWQSATVCGMHGQTVWHAPPSRSPGRAHTLQLGSSGALAALLELPVVGDMRASDIARGGEGAPIVPFAHWFFTPPGPVARLVVNVGGIANYTAVRGELTQVQAADLGPGMMITDALSRYATMEALDCDHDGQLSREGTVDPGLVEWILGHSFFRRPRPRSTGREDFGPDFVDELLGRFSGLSGPTLVRSSLFATAKAIADALHREHPDTGELLLTGGGARHPGLRAYVSELVAPVPVLVDADGVFAPEHHESAAMALIAARTMARLPSSLPQITGARSPGVLGHVHWP